MLKWRGQYDDFALKVWSLLFFIWQWAIFQAKGPNWVMIPQDLGYNYLLNGVNVLNGDPIGTLIHPAITVTYFHAGMVWLLYHLFDWGPLNWAVVASAESYSTGISLVTCILGAVAVYALSRAAYRATGNLLMALTPTAIVAIAPASQLVMNLFAAPENFLLILMLGQLAWVFAYYPAAESQDAESSDPAEGYWDGMGFILGSAVLGGLALATKFTAAPMLILPFLLIQGWRRRLLFPFMVALVLTALFLPVILDPVNWRQFLQDMHAIIASASYEQSAMNSSSRVAAVWQQLAVQFEVYPIPFYLSFALVAGGPLFLLRGWRQRLRGMAAVRLYWSVLLGSLLAMAFLMLRPRPQYFVMYTLLQGVGLVAMGGLLWQGVGARLQASRWGGRWVRSGLGLAWVCVFGGLFAYHVADPTWDYWWLGKKRDVALEMLRTVDSARDSVALVTAIPASYVGTALEHANQTSFFKSWREIDQSLPGNHYNYTFDGFDVWNHARVRLGLEDLLDRYGVVYFWTNPTDFEQDTTTLRGPRALFEPVIDGSAERLARLRAVALSLRYERGGTANADRGWHWGGCEGGRPCLTLNLDRFRRRPVSYLEWEALDDADARRMPREIQLWGQVESGDWQLLKSIHAERPWQPGEVRRERIESPADYQRYRLVDISSGDGGGEAAWPGRVMLYGGAAHGAIKRRVPLYTRYATAEHRRFSEIPRVWETVGDFPLIYPMALDHPIQVDSYELGTANEGEGGRDSTGRMPLSWELQGSRDGQTWVALDVRKDQPAWAPDETRRYTVHNDRTFSRYRLVVIRSANPSIVRLYRLVLHDGQSPDQGPFPSQVMRYGFYEFKGKFPLSLELEYPRKTRISHYTLSSGGDGVNGSQRMPVAWAMQGSDDGVHWQDIDKRRARRAWGNGETRRYVLPSEAAFRYFRLVVDQTGNDEHVLRISQVNLFGP